MDLRSESRKDLGDNETGESRRHCLSGSNQWGPGGGLLYCSGAGLGGLRGRSRLAQAVVLASLACLEEAVGRGSSSSMCRVGSVCVRMCVYVYASTVARELSSEGAGEDGRGRRQFAWRLRVLLGLEQELGHWDTGTDGTGQKATCRQAGRVGSQARREAGRARGGAGEGKRGKGGPGRGLGGELGLPGHGLARLAGRMWVTDRIGRLSH